MNNPKDITMATGYVLSYVFILKFLKQLPKPKLSTTLGLSLAIGIALGIRIGGLLLIPYLFLFYGLAMWQQHGLRNLLDFSKFKTDVWPSFRYVLLASVLGYFIGLFFWPYGLIGPFSNPFETLSVSSKFPATIRMLFDGQMIMSTEIPWYYIPKWIYITAPLFALIGAVASFFIIPAYRKDGKLLLVFVYFTLAFPVFYIIYKKAVLYDGMRHMYFVYPSIVILAGLAFDYFIKSQQKNIKYAVVAIALVLVALPARFMFANHPNEAVYFNELIGGIKGAYGNFETDYYMNSMKQCEQWLRKNVEIKPRPDGSRMIFYSNAVGPIGNYFIDDTAKLACGYTSYRTRFEKDGDYFILYQRFVDRQLLVNGCFPPEQAVFTVKVDGVPIACVIKKDDNRDFLGIDAIKKNDFETGIKYLEPFAAKYPKNEGVLTNLGLAYLNLSRPDDAIRALNQSLQLNNENLNAIYYMAMAYQMKGDNSTAQYYNNILQQLQR
jgi:tetratricopeptide (TPR) repeat protein